MTVHASKGLEFPIVFLVNLARGVAQRRHPIRVRFDATNPEASVSIDAFLSEADAIEPVVEREETKRLLYVGLTRARRSAVPVGGGRGGHGEDEAAEPSASRCRLSLQRRIEGGRARRRRASGVDRPGGDPRHSRRPGGGGIDGSRPVAGPTGTIGDGAGTAAAAGGLAADRRGRLEPAVPRAAVTDLAGNDGQTSLDSTGPEDGEEPAGGRLVGRLVHRLLARFPPGAAADEATVLATVEALVTDEERAQVPELDAAIARAVRLHRRLASRPDVQSLFAGGTAAFEVPVSLVQDGRVLRGTIDCLIRRPDGALVVVEVKTGPPRPEHQRQLEAYLGAIQALGPGIRATGCLVHP